MREIKFRAWDENRKEMFQVFGMSWKANGDFIVANDEWNLGDYYAPGERYAKIECVMQYTGLKDKNGVDIYDGDIIKFDGEQEYGVIEWGEGEWSYILYDGGVRQNQYFSLSGRSDNYIIPFDIVGNIYENPDIVKVEK